MAGREKTIEQKEKTLAKNSILGAVLLTIIATYITLMMSAYMYDFPRAGYGEALTGAFQKMLTNPLYFMPVTYPLSLTAGVVTMVLLFCFLSYSYNKIRVHHDPNTIRGSAKWADLKMLANKYADFEGKGFKEAYNNAILSKNFQMSMNQGKHFHALNTLILGTTGSGKSRYFLKPNLLQMNCSYVITDPSGGILQECGEALRRFGYHIKVFDLVQMGNCDTYNPLKYCHKESDIKKVVQAFIKNTDTSEGQSTNKDPFWDDSMNAFLCSNIALLTTCPEGYDIPYAQIPEITGGVVYEPCFANLCEFTRMANKKWEPLSGIKPLPGVKLGDGKNNTANASELAMIYENLRAWECKRQDCDPEIMIKPYCLREWENFRIAPEKTSTTILMTTAVRLDPFNIEQVRNLTSTDSLDLDNFGNKRDVLFVITPTNDKTYNFLVSFLYTQLFDILYQNGETKSAGSIDLKLPSGELVRHFSKGQVEANEHVAEIEKIQKASYKKVEGGGILKGHKVIKKKTLFETKKVKVPATFDDGWYDIVTTDGELISRRPTKELAEKYIKDLANAKKVPGNGKSVPTHVRFLLDEFPNLGEIPEFKEKLATMRKYEISCTVICQTITQLKGMYEKDYEVIDANCPQTIFLGGDENSNNEYISKKIGMATVKKGDNSMGHKKDVSTSYGTDQRELIKPDELGRIPFSDEIVLIYGEDPIYDEKYDYPAHKNYKFTHDYACDLGLHSASVFDRSCFKNEKLGMLSHRAEIPTAIPSVERLDTPAKFAEKIKTLLGANSTGEVIHKMRNNYTRYDFESNSVEGAF